MINEKINILEEIKETIENCFLVSVIEHVEINKGLLNLKWKFKTDNGKFFVKQYNAERNPVSKEQRLNTALSYQIKLSENGIRCPRIFPFKEEVILKTRQNIRFIVTEFCEGKLIDAGKINCNQSHDLGVELAKIHNIINNRNNAKGNPTWVIPSQEQLIGQWDKNWLMTNDTNAEDINHILKLQKSIFENIDLNIFKRYKHGWAHSDLWCDNVLFLPDKLSAILDFDRLQYIYPELDISRAILSFALDSNYLRVDIIKAFMNGYNQNGNISVDDIIHSLKLLYCLESFWWLNSESFNSEGPPKRFAEEMVWLSVNWFNLERILGELRNCNFFF